MARQTKPVPVLCPVAKKPDIEALRPKAAPVVNPAAEEILSRADLVPEQSQATMAIADDLLPIKEEEEEEEEERCVSNNNRPSEYAPTPRRIDPSSGLRSIPAPEVPGTQTATTLLSHHRSEQEQLTNELAEMASRLKDNSLAFASLLENDKVAMESAEGKLERNLGGMTKQRERLKGYTKKGGVTMWFTIGAVLAVTSAWFVMFGLMRIA